MKLIPRNTDDEGGYSDESLEKRKRIYHTYDPTAGYSPMDAIMNFNFGGNKAKGDQNEYWKAYLGLPNKVPKMNKNAYTEWDSEIEKQKELESKPTSDFYGTTDRMDLQLQAMADTLNLGKLVRDYKANYNMAEDLGVFGKSTAKRLYRDAKKVLDNPNKWQQMDGDAFMYPDTLDTEETNPLGMLAKFGMKWVPEENAIYIHDTYDFPYPQRWFVGERPKEMKIRSKIHFDPKKGSKLLRKKGDSN